MTTDMAMGTIMATVITTITKSELGGGCHSVFSIFRQTFQATWRGSPVSEEDRNVLSRGSQTLKAATLALTDLFSFDIFSQRFTSHVSERSGIGNASDERV